MSIYAKRYSKIINHYKNTTTEGYSEKHHIVPKCMGGTNDCDNLVDLPAKAHYLVHWILTKMYPTNKRLLRAFTAFSMDRYGVRKFSAGQYAKLREAHAKVSKQQMLEYHETTNTNGANNSFYGMKHSTESKRRMRERKLGVSISEQHRLKIAENSKKSCLVNGQQFESVREAKEILGFSNGTFHRHRVAGKITFEYI